MEEIDMGKIVVSETVSLDGVMQDPTDEAGFRFAGWFNRLAGTERAAWAKSGFAETLDSAALLLGRRTYEWFVAHGWAAREDEWADTMRRLPKYIVSSTLDQPDWANSTVLGGDVVKAITTLTEQVDGDIVVYGSGRLVPTLMEHDLVDELRLTICPFALGTGERLFGETSELKTMRLVRAGVVGDNLVSLTYQPIR
jgi:dihydrofolate reductase